MAIPLCGWCRGANKESIPAAEEIGLCGDCWKFFEGRGTKDMQILLLLEVREVVTGLNFIAQRGHAPSGRF